MFLHRVGAELLIPWEALDDCICRTAQLNPLQKWGQRSFLSQSGKLFTGLDSHGESANGLEAQICR